VRVRRLTWGEVWGRRLARHFLLRPAAAGSVVEVTGALCGVHAQMMPSAEIEIGLRVAGATRADLRAELWERRGLVKTYGPRGTLHLFPAKELPLWLGALRAVPEPNGSMILRPSELDRLVDAIGAALDGRQLTRDELGAELAGRVGDWVLRPGQQAFGGTNPPLWTMAVGPAARAGVLCFAPNRGTRVSYARLDQWIDTGPLIEPEQALTEVIRRFLHTYGPATHRELARWLGVGEDVAKPLFDSLRDELEPVDADGWRAWMLAGSVDGAERADGTLHLLPHFDCYVVGAHPRARFMHPEWTDRGLTRGTATLPVLLVDGVLAGLWHRKRTARRLDVTVDAFSPLTPAQCELVEARARRIAAILEIPTATVHFGPVAGRPHL
jgi:hypothetical protein